MDNIEIYLLILVAVLEVIDGQGIALRILRVLMGVIGGDTNGQKVKHVNSKEV